MTFNEELGISSMCPLQLHGSTPYIINNHLITLSFQYSLFNINLNFNYIERLYSKPTTKLKVAFRDSSLSLQIYLGMFCTLS